MRRTLALASLVLCAATPLAAQGTWRLHLDPARLRATSDSFAFMVDGTPRGWQKLSAVGMGDDWTLSDEVEMGGFVRQRSEVRFGRGFIERSLRQQGMASGKPMKIVLDRTGGRMQGSALTPSGGAEAVPIDVAADDDVIDDNAVTPLLAVIAWKEGLTLTVPVLKSGKGTIAANTLTVRGASTVTVPAGTFETWEVAVSEGERPWLVAHVTTSAPYRIVKMGPPAGRMSVQLVK